MLYQKPEALHSLIANVGTATLGQTEILVQYARPARIEFGILRPIGLVHVARRGMRRVLHHRAAHVAAEWRNVL